MLSAFPVAVLVGTLLGFLAGLGIGGGSLLLLWLTLVLGLGPSEARTINLLFFLPAAAAACFFRRKQGVLNFRKVLPAALAGCITAMVGTWLSAHLDMAVLKKGFGILLMATGLRELLWQPKKKAP